MHLCAHVFCFFFNKNRGRLLLQSFVAGLTFICSDRCNDTNVYGNSDVKANDRLPILACTHESVCTKKTCVKKHALKRTTRISQRAQSVTNGYFGGYIGKRQPTGKLEVRKCMDKMQRLRQ